MTPNSLSSLVLGGVFLLSSASLAEAKRATQQPSLRDRVLKASVILPERMCTGSVVRSEHEVLTAAHCVTEGVSSVTVRLPSGSEREASIVHLDRDADLALLHLSEPTGVKPLPVADQLPRRGSSLLFVGRTDRKTRTQQAKVERLGRCPSLPELPNALFTTLDARPGDSGAPLVDAKGRVAAIVHGGARCEIAVPTAAIASLRYTPPAKPVTPPAKDDDPATDDDSDGWSIQPTENGFKFRWSFHWRSD
jgi:S1-C subfamily serine protease